MIFKYFNSNNNQDLKRIYGLQKQDNVYMSPVSSSSNLYPLFYGSPANSRTKVTRCIPERNSLAKPIWSLSLAIATTRTSFACGNAMRIVCTKASADSLVWAEFKQENISAILMPFTDRTSNDLNNSRSEQSQIL